MSDKQQRLWHDAFHLKHALSCMRKVEPIRWAEVLQELRRSRRYRAELLKDARDMIQFRLSLIFAGIKAHE